ncbi:MAG: hypothetical protein R3E79_45390 [Caldilineaceae bacterium]
MTRFPASIPPEYFRRPGGDPLYDMTVYGLHATGVLGTRPAGHRHVRCAGHRREFRGESLPTDMDDNTFMVLG